MIKTKVRVIANFVYLFICGYLFTQTLFEKKVLESGVNFALLGFTTFVFLGVGWIATIVRFKGPNSPYVKFRATSTKQLIHIVRVHTCIIISTLLYSNIVLAMVLLFLATDKLHYVGMLAIFGVPFSVKLAFEYLTNKQEEINRSFRCPVSTM